MWQHSRTRPAACEKSRGEKFASETRNLIWIFLIKYEQKFHFSEAAAAFTRERHSSAPTTSFYLYIFLSWKNRNSNYFEMKFCSLVGRQREESKLLLLRQLFGLRWALQLLASSYLLSRSNIYVSLPNTHHLSQPAKHTPYRHHAFLS